MFSLLILRNNIRVKRILNCAADTVNVSESGGTQPLEMFIKGIQLDVYSEASATAIFMSQPNVI